MIISPPVIPPTKKKHNCAHLKMTNKFSKASETLEDKLERMVVSNGLFKEIKLPMSVCLFIIYFGVSPIS